MPDRNLPAIAINRQPDLAPVVLAGNGLQQPPSFQHLQQFGRLLQLLSGHVELHWFDFPSREERHFDWSTSESSRVHDVRRRCHHACRAINPYPHGVTRLQRESINPNACAPFALRSLPMSTTVTLGGYLSRSRLTTVRDFVYPVWNDELSDFRGYADHQLHSSPTHRVPQPVGTSLYSSSLTSREPFPHMADRQTG